MRKLRIAQVTNLMESVPPSHQHGLEQLVYDLTEELAKMGHQITLFATADSKTSARLIPLWPKATMRDPYAKKKDPSFYTKLTVAAALNQQSEFDIIHDHSRFIAPYFAPLVKTPIVSTIHHPISFEESYKKEFPPDYQPYFKNAWETYRKKVHTVVVSRFQAEKYAAPSTVIHNGTNIHTVLPNYDPGKYLAFLGYITPDKGVAEAIQAVLKTDETLLISGPLDQTELNQKYFSEKIHPFLDNQKIKYLDPLSHEEKINFLKNAKAVLMPIQWDEPFGLVAIESMTCGTPVIAWNRAAMPEIIENGVSGFLINSVEEMAQKISQINKLDRKNARKRVEENFTSEIMAQNYVNLYNQILKKN